nr:isoleucine--tRNA ligase [Burkholderiales bacterium]
ATLAKPAFAVIWTTTPWTLPANQAVTVHADFDYALVEGPDYFLVVAEALVEACMQRYDIAQWKIVATCKGAALEGARLNHPFQPRKVQMILGDHVTLDTGTGLVHTAPAHGVEDFVAGAKYDLPVVNPVRADGTFDDSVGFLYGESVWGANDSIIELLEERTLLLHRQQWTHSYPHCWRHKTPLIFRATHQWFVAMEADGPDAKTLRATAMAAVEATEFFPAWGRARLEAMIGHRPDWCVSRQRSWGTPMTLVVHRDTGALHPRALELMEQAAQVVERGGIEAWFALDLATLLGDEAAQYEKVPDTLDVWFDSGSTHASVLGRRAELTKPADLYLEGSDQHRGWFQSSLLVGCAVDGRAPYRQLLTHGFVVDGEGRKMSKSRGNVIAPQKVVDTLGADILRLWVASTDYSGELSISDEILKRVVESYRRIRNTLRFLLANVSDFDPTVDALPPAQWLDIDRYAVALTARVQADIVAAYDRYEFHTVVQRLTAFCSEDLGGFWLDILKDRLYTTAPKSVARRSAQSALWQVTHALLRWMAPVLTFTADEAWGVFTGRSDDSVLFHTWAELPADAQADALVARWTTIRAVRAEAQKALEAKRAEGAIGASLQAGVALALAGERHDACAMLGDDLRFVLITSQASVVRVADAATESITVTPLAHAKCGRCWHWRADVGHDPAHPDLCGRCTSNLHGAGEARVAA